MMPRRDPLFSPNNYFLVFSVFSPLVASFLLYLFLRVSIRIIL